MNKYRAMCESTWPLLFRKKPYETAGTGVPVVHRDNEEGCEDIQAEKLEKLENIVK